MTAYLYSHGNVITGENKGWIKSYDLDARDGRGTVVTTSRKSEAMSFEDGIAAFEAWRTPSTVHPLRGDGRPNRPLTALTIEILNDDQEPMS
jgi:hypothetical protein